MAEFIKITNPTSGEEQYPITSPDAVIDSNGKSLTELLDEKVFNRWQEKITMIGNGDTAVIVSQPVIANHAYVLMIENPEVSMSGVSQYTRLAIGAYDSEDQKIGGNLINIQYNEDLNSFYSFIAPNGTDYIHISCRCAVNEKFNVLVQDVTLLDKQEFCLITDVLPNVNTTTLTLDMGNTVVLRTKYGYEAISDIWSSDTSKFKAIPLTSSSQTHWNYLVYNVTTHLFYIKQYNQAVGRQSLVDEIILGGFNKPISSGDTIQSINFKFEHTIDGYGINSIKPLADRVNQLPVGYHDEFTTSSSGTYNKFTQLNIPSDGSVVVRLWSEIKPSYVYFRFTDENNNVITSDIQYYTGDNCYVVPNNTNQSVGGIRIYLADCHSAKCIVDYILLNSISSNDCESLTLGNKVRILTDAVDFTNRGFYNRSGVWGSSNNWHSTDAIFLPQGSTVRLVANSTTNGQPCIVEVDANKNYIAYCVLSTATTPKVYSYTADHDCYIVLQGYYYRNSITAFIVNADKKITCNKTSIFELNDSSVYDNLLKQAKFGSDMMLCWFSDIHGYAKQLYRLMAYTELYQSSIDDILHTGDIVSSHFEDDFSYWGKCKADKVLNCIGNHDLWATGGSVGDITGKQAYDKFFAPYISSWNVTQPQDAESSGLCYYYKDYNGIRLIVLDNLHIGTEQTTWLTSVLEDAKTNNKAVVIAQHYAPDEMTLINCPFTTLYETPTSATNTGFTNAVDAFISDGGEFICWLAGHTHKDFIGTLLNHPNQLCLVIENGSCRDDGGSSIREVSTKSEDAFNFIAFDTTRKLVKIVRIGNNVDRSMRDKTMIAINYDTKTVL